MMWTAKRMTREDGKGLNGSNLEVIDAEPFSPLITLV